MSRSLARWPLAAPFLLIAACNTVPETTGSLGSASKTEVSRNFQRGSASWYQMGRRTASGELFDPNGMTAAHPSLPFGTRVRVVHESSGQSVVVRINDRGPFVRGRIIDLARGPAQAIGIISTGTAFVSLQKLD